MGIEAAIYTKLTGHAGLSALVSTRVYPGLAPQDQTAPYIVYELSRATRVTAMGSDTGIVRAMFQFSVFCDSYDAATGVVAVSEQLRDCLQRWRGTVESVVIQDTFYEAQVDLYDESTFIHQRAMDFEINYLE